MGMDMQEIGKNMSVTVTGSSSQETGQSGDLKSR